MTESQPSETPDSPTLPRQAADRQIGTTVGILMATETVTQANALQLLRHASNHLNRKLIDIPDHVHLTGGLPRPPARR